jgi:hypothetical protein
MRVVVAKAQVLGIVLEGISLELLLAMSAQGVDARVFPRALGVAQMMRIEGPGRLAMRVMGMVVPGVVIRIIRRGVEGWPRLIEEMEERGLGVSLLRVEEGHGWLVAE